MLRHWLDWFCLQGEGYAWWSGLGSGSSWIAAIALYLWHHNCHQPGCWRLARRHHHVTGTVWCHRHHPDAKGL